MQLKTKNGITLIALVVTIIVLLILAGVSINTLFGDTGIIKSAQNAKDEMQIAALKDRIETVKVNWGADRIIDSSVTVERFWKDLVDAEIIIDADRDVKKENEATENGITKTEYKVDTKEGYQVEIIIITDETGKIEIKIEEIINNESALPKVTVKLSNPTTNGVTVTADVRRAEGKLIYSYKLEEEEEYTKYIETEETEIKITGLEENKTYEIKVEASNKNGTGYGRETVITKNLETPTVELLEKTWNNGKATIKISTTSSYTLQYQIDAIEENGWKNYSEVATTGITGLEHGQTVYTRIYDGTNGSLGKDFAIQDGEEPASATITATTSYNITSGTTTNIKATVTHADNESGVNVTSCKYVFNSSETGLGTDESLYTEGTFSSNGQEISKTVSAGTYYLHVLTVDNAENKKETVKGPITVVQKVTGISLNKTSAEIGKGETLQLTATVTPENASDKGLTWSSNSTSVATVSQTGVVTAVGKGTATITATAKDGSGKNASCTVTVKPTFEFTGTTNTSTSYVKYYADLNGDGEITEEADGIIFADLLKGGSGTWNSSGKSSYSSYGTYSIGTISSAKSYKVSSTNYTEGKFESAKVLQANGSGADRFYVMALKDLDTSRHCWYYSARYYNNNGISDYNTVTSENFGTGKTNTSTMITKWNGTAYGSQNGDSSYTDVWGVVQTKYAQGWFVPSRAEWAAFGNTFNITKSNYNSTFGLSNYYWSSSLDTTNCAWGAGFDGGHVYDRSIDSNFFVRLCATF